MRDEKMDQIFPVSPVFPVFPSSCSKSEAPGARGIDGRSPLRVLAGFPLSRLLSVRYYLDRRCAGLDAGCDRK
jgi:hypothetical protein